jgi:hypothetical protein
MKRNFTISALVVFAMIMSTFFAGNVLAQREQNWTSENTFASAPEASTGVVINEIYGGSETGGVYNADFIELCNLSSTPVNISDWSVQYYTAGQINAGAPTSTAHIPDATILGGNSCYVIRVSPIRGTGLPLPCENLDASASFAETGIASEGGKLVLSSTGADLDSCTSTSPLVVDRVGYGETPVVCNETANAGPPTASNSIQRRSGEADTDDNSADFTAFSAPTPCTQLIVLTSAMVNVGGRVTSASGRSISGALIEMTNSEGIVRSVYTGKSGNYNFADIEIGQILVLEVKANCYNFSERMRVVSLNEELTTLDFTADESVVRCGYKR